MQHIERNEKALRHKKTHQQDQAGQGSHKSPQPSLFPYKGKSKEKENDLVMKNMCRINYIAVLAVLYLLLSYHVTWFEILPLVLLDHQFDRPPALYHNSGGCGKGVQILRSYRDY